MIENFRIAVAMAAMGVLVGCTTTLNPLTSAEISKMASERKAKLVRPEQEPLNGRLGLHEAMARAIKYNLDHKIETANVYLTQSSKALNKFDMLPNLVASGEYSSRGTNPGGRSVNLTTGVTSPTASRSAAAKNSEGNLTLSWDILDFGLSYYRSQQSGNDILIAQEQRRAVLNRLVESVRASYWRAVSHERLNGRITTVVSRAERALGQSRNLTNGGFEDRTTGLIYQRDLLRVIGEMQALQRDLAISKPQLAALVNLKPGEHFHVRIPQRRTLPSVKASASRLVDIALVNRPELREISYEARNIDLDEKAAVLELLPSLRPYLTASTTSNNLITNQNWVSAGARVSWDLMNLFKAPSNKRFLKSRKVLNEARALALTHSVATQVHVAKTRYDFLRTETRTSERYADISAKISGAIQAERAEGLIGEQEVVLEEVGSILAELRFDARYAELQSAYAAVFAATGLNNYPGTLTGHESLVVLEKAIHDLWIKRGEGFH